jgi:uncharacterized protein YjbI with pentapeptide repeats
MIKQGKPADFNDHCGLLDPKDENFYRWLDVCREVSSQFLVDLLTQAPWREAVPFAGVRIKGARIAEDIDLENAKLIRPIEIFGSRIEGAIKLNHARTDSSIQLDGSLMNGAFAADSLHAESDLFLGNGTTFNRDVSLNGAKIDGFVNMIGASFGGTLDARRLQVGSSLLMQSDDRHKASFNGVVLNSAKITGQVNMIGASFAGALNADSLQVGGSLLMYSDDRHKASFKGVVLNSAKITGQIDMDGANFEGKLDADALQVGDMLLMRSQVQNKTSFKGVNLRGAKVTGQIAMDGTSFDGTLNADSLQAGGHLFMRDANCAQAVVMVSVHVGGSLDLRGAALAGLDLSDTSIAGDLALGGKNGKPGALNLHNAHIGNLMDAQDAWPAKGQLHLDGFTFSHLGGFRGETGPEMRARGMDWWDKWARLDTNYSPAPYAQLAAALTSAGDRDAANEIRYYGRVRERETAKGLAYVWSGFLQYVAGFGIGTYTFRVLFWVIGISLLGALYLWTRVKGVRDGNHGFFWCFGASLARLLPVIEINKEFTTFFDDPERKRLTGRQTFIFSAMGIVGFVLGAILIAAVSGLTQGS